MGIRDRTSNRAVCASKIVHSNFIIQGHIVWVPEPVASMNISFSHKLSEIKWTQANVLFQRFAILYRILLHQTEAGKDILIPARVLLLRDDIFGRTCLEHSAYYRKYKCRFFFLLEKSLVHFILCMCVHDDSSSNSSLASHLIFSVVCDLSLAWVYRTGLTGYVAL